MKSEQNTPRKLVYLGSTEKDSNKLPNEVKELFIQALKLALIGDQHENAKSLKGFHGRSVLEVVADHRSGTI